MTGQFIKTILFTYFIDNNNKIYLSSKLNNIDLKKCFQCKGKPYFYHCLKPSFYRVVCDCKYYDRDSYKEAVSVWNINNRLLARITTFLRKYFI